MPIAKLSGVELYDEETGNLHVAEFLAAVERGRCAGWTTQTTSTEEVSCDIASR